MTPAEDSAYHWYEREWRDEQSSRSPGNMSSPPGVFKMLEVSLLITYTQAHGTDSTPASGYFNKIVLRSVGEVEAARVVELAPGHWSSSHWKVGGSVLNVAAGLQGRGLGVWMVTCRVVTATGAEVKGLVTICCFYSASSLHIPNPGSLHTSIHSSVHSCSTAGRVVFVLQGSGVLTEHMWHMWDYLNWKCLKRCERTPAGFPPPTSQLHLSACFGPGERLAVH